MDRTSKALLSNTLIIVRWLLFFITGFLMPGIAQLLTGIPALHYQNGTALIIGFLCVFAGWFPVYISPRRKIGAFLLIFSICVSSIWTMMVSSNVPSRCWVIYFYTA